MIRRIAGPGAVALAGVGLVVTGIALVSTPAAFIVAGVLVLAGVVGYLRGGAA